MCIKVDTILAFLEPEISSGRRWGDLPLTVQIEAVNRLYNENKKFYDSRVRGSCTQGLCDILIEDCYSQYEFLQTRINPFYDDKEA